MKFVSLFAGIGGIDLGLERAGHQCVGQVEIDPYCRKVLEKHWPNVPRHDDVKTFHGSEFGDFDLLTGGYPCQPFSVAGQRKGENDPRHLWPEVHRIIRNVRPAYVLLENVTGHLALGFGRVLGDLAEGGYDAEWRVLSAARFGAPHVRERLFVLAYPSGTGLSRPILKRPSIRESTRAAPTKFGNRVIHSGFRDGRNPSNLRVGDGFSRRVASRQVKALGNAVVPQVAEYLGRLLPKANK